MLLNKQMYTYILYKSENIAVFSLDSFVCVEIGQIVRISINC